MRVARLVRRTGLAVALAGGVALAGLATPAFADPPGNNGTIKIDKEEFDSHPDNQPHVGCVFQVDFYGYDKGDLDAKVTFKVWPPTADKETLLTDTVFIGGDDNSGGGSTAGLDASKTYTLDFTGFTPDPKKGFHVKLIINAEGSQGDDRKHKVFWVKDCPPPPSPSPTKTPDDEESEKPDDEETEKPEPVPTSVPAGADGSSGSSAAGLLGLALTASGAVAGTAVLVRRRRFLHDS
jgi:hypothetical protein